MSQGSFKDLGRIVRETPEFTEVAMKPLQLWRLLLQLEEDIKQHPTPKKLEHAKRYRSALIPEMLDIGKTLLEQKREAQEMVKKATDLDRYGMTREDAADFLYNKFVVEQCIYLSPEFAKACVDLVEDRSSQT